MTKQKFYEYVILMTYRLSLNCIEHEINKIHGNINNMSFDELMMRRSIAGLPNNIPLKQPFDKLGFKYIAQLLGFVKNSEDDELTEEYFKFLKQHKKYVDFSNDDHFSLFYQCYVDTLTNSSKYFSEELGTYIFDNIDKVTNNELRIKFLQLVRAFGKVTLKTNLFDINNAVRKYYA